MSARALRDPRPRRWATGLLLAAGGAVASWPLAASWGIGADDAPAVGGLLEARPGGAASIVDPSARALSQPIAGLSIAQRSAFDLGEAFFNTDFDESRGTRRSGLGPLFNAASCSACHNAGGRGAPVAADGSASVALVLQLGERPGDGGQPGPSRRFGQVVNPFAIAGNRAEGRVQVIYDPRTVPLPLGGRVALQQPHYRVELADGAPWPEALVFSPRLAPAVIGAGLLEAIPAAAILEREDAFDRDGDGISGRPNWLASDRGERHLGRFGWKANQATLAGQIASALANEMGVTTSLRPLDDYGRVHTPTGIGQPELADADLAAIVSFQRFAGVPVRTGLDGVAVRRGAARFLALGCEACHRATLRTASVPDAPALSNQVIHPFSDLLLHDLGDGLADGRPDGEASGREWRTPPLWGLGLTGRVSRRIAYLHDGRARSLGEAILWHGGEAQPAADRFAALDEAERGELIAFLSSL